MGNTNYEFHSPTFQLLKVKHEFARKGLQYNMIKIKSATWITILDKIHAHSLYCYAP